MMIFSSFKKGLDQKKKNKKKNQNKNKKNRELVISNFPLFGQFADLWFHLNWIPLTLCDGFVCYNLLAL